MASSKACAFCDIVAKRSVEFLYEDEDFCVIKDIRPAASYHVLVIPKLHIEQSKLYSIDVDTIHRMVAIGESLLVTKDAKHDEARFGFHLPPFYSVNHLHLHVIHPVTEMTCLSRVIFLQNSFWFGSVDTVVSRLKKD